MSDSASQPEFGHEDLWRQIFHDGHPVLTGKQRRYRMLPGMPRCKMCFAPFGGFGGWIARRIGLRPSFRNPRFCNACDKFIEQFPGGAEVPVSILFCDLRGSVALGMSWVARAMPRRLRGCAIWWWRRCGSMTVSCWNFRAIP
ncbi:hypothetical protein PE067_04445 [Paracoccus sp. DMF-8]|uniref:hypothetical protein n=1 Tax=Paracoccus sp. DMF-8 TaxID=3019445 RepID=UPI0023E7D565|nr:hypothetical protein [Paracoccus sp. DMF-8]MDF3605465.1 hypothetical protein [Paracoccus sp. DMF-8]